MVRETERALVEVTDELLHMERYAEFVGDPGAGAISSFVGVTRNTFGGKEVLRLEYEAYAPMAEKELMKLCTQMFSKWDLIKVAIGHRTGVVAVKEASVIIAVSSAHRTASLEAVHWAIDELKATVPIWKKEMFADGGVWKENAESRALLLRAGVNRSRLPQVRLSWFGMGAALLLPMLSSILAKR